MAFLIDVNFIGEQELRLKDELASEGFSLVGFKGAANGASMVGVPAWFSIPVRDLLDRNRIAVDLEFGVFVFNERDIDRNTVLTPQSRMGANLSDRNSFILSAFGQLMPDGNPGIEGTITVRSERQLGDDPVLVGIGAELDGEILPFCVYVLRPQSTVNMEPLEDVLLFFAQGPTRQGSVVGTVTTPGAKFMLNQITQTFDLRVIDNTFGLTNRAGSNPVTPVSAGANIVQILNA
ncbi:MAG: hypothetical protein AAGN35_24810 [Bacteroidota bacterium]